MRSINLKHSTKFLDIKALEIIGKNFYFSFAPHFPNLRQLTI